MRWGTRSALPGKNEKFNEMGLGLGLGLGLVWKRMCAKKLWEEKEKKKRKKKKKKRKKRKKTKFFTIFCAIFCTISTHEAHVCQQRMCANRIQRPVAAATS